MKLSSRYSRLNILAILFIFVLASVVYYFLISYITFGQVDETLQMERARIETFAARYHRVPEIIPVKDQLIRFLPAAGFQKSFFSTAPDFDSIGRDSALFRKLFFTFSTGDHWNTAMVGKSMESTENLFKSIIAITIGMMLVILVVYFIINTLVLNRLWQPFYNGLQVMKDYQVGKKHPAFPDSNIDEFNFMNAVLQQATVNADRDYLVLKEFTENASHEMQTPLTIIRSKLDLLIQNERISTEYGHPLQAVYMAIQKLSTLNRSLLLLSRIDNNQFSETSVINLEKEIQEKISQFREILHDKELQITAGLEPVEVNMNTDLCDFLLNNILSNAFRHNTFRGTIEVTLKEPGLLVVSNTGSPQALDTNRIFTRFYKPENNNEHNGLGLSIMKQICLVSGCAISYRFTNGIHSFIINWLPVQVVPVPGYCGNDDQQQATF